MKSDFGIPNVVSQKPKGKLTIFFEKFIFFKTENVTVAWMRKNKQQTLVRGKRVVVDKTLNLAPNSKTLILPKTYAKHELLPKANVSKKSRLYHTGNNVQKIQKAKPTGIRSNLARSPNKVI